MGYPLGDKVQFSHINLTLCLIYLKYEYNFKKICILNLCVCVCVCKGINLKKLINLKLFKKN